MRILKWITHEASTGRYFSVQKMESGLQKLHLPEFLADALVHCISSDGVHVLSPKKTCDGGSTLGAGNRRLGMQSWTVCHGKYKFPPLVELNCTSRALLFKSVSK